jgi:hypothetical protein
MPAWRTREGGGVEAAEDTARVTAEQLRPFFCVAYEAVPTHRLPAELPPARWSWALRPRPGARGRMVVHDHDCPLVTGDGQELGVQEALDAGRRLRLGDH